jgi:inner membrane protein
MWIRRRVIKTFVEAAREDYALLIGSIGVFVILGVFMFLFRKINWYNIKIGNQEEKG